MPRETPRNDRQPPIRGPIRTTELGGGNPAPGASIGDQGDPGRSEQLGGQTGVSLGEIKKPVVNVPTITAPTMTEEQKQAGELGGVGDVTAPQTPTAQPVEAQQVVNPAAVNPQTAQATQAGQVGQVTAAGYDATKVDPMGAQAEAATTDYKPEVAAAQAQTPEAALVSTQMQELTRGMQTGDIPMWAQGAVAAVDAQLAARGMSRSSIGQAELTNAIMQAALPIAQQNAQTVQQTSLQNLQNRQTANNLQAQLQTNVELANLSNEQQTVLANQASKQAMMLSNQAAENAGKQFNAQSQNQVNTFMANLRQQTEQFNVAQANAMSQFNAQQTQQASLANAQMGLEASKFNSSQVNAMAQFNQQLSTDLQKFNSTQAMQADMFNKQNAMAIAQSNVQWRRQIATSETQMTHEANMQNAQNRFGLSMAELNNYWQVSRDLASWAWQSSENAKSREAQLVINSTNNAAAADLAKKQMDAAREQSWGEAIGAITGAVITGLFNEDD